MIRKASLEEAKLIYTKNMEKDFPEDEIPDYNKFVKLTEKNIHDVYLYNTNNSDVAYFITVEKDNNILITHLAVIKEYRSKGIGKVLLEEIKKHFKDKNILIVEVEAESRANNKEELDIINKRKRYYSNLGFVQCQNMSYILYNVDYDILTYSPNNRTYEPNEVKKIIEEIYKAVGIDKTKLKIEITWLKIKVDKRDTPFCLCSNKNSIYLKNSFKKSKANTKNTNNFRKEIMVVKNKP